MTSNRKRSSKDFLRKVNQTETRSKQNEKRVPGAGLIRQVEQRVSSAVTPIVISNVNLAAYQAETAQETASDASDTADLALGEAARIEDVVIPTIVDPIIFDVNRSALTFFQETAPTYPGTLPTGIPENRVEGPHVWFKESTGETFQWDRVSQWVLVEDKQLLLTMAALGYTQSEMEQIKAGTHPALKEAVETAQSEIEYWDTVKFPDLETAIQTAQASADGNITTHFDATQPTGLNDTTDLGDLWYDPDGKAWRWRGSLEGGWQMITDTELTAAIGRIGDAETAIDTLNNTTLPDLQTTITTDLSAYVDQEIESIDLSDAGAKIIRSQSAPSAGAYRDGDLWYQYDGVDLIGFWIYDTGAWASHLIENSIIASGIDAGKMTTGYLDADRIDARTITTEKLLIGQFDNLIADIVRETIDGRGGRDHDDVGSAEWWNGYVGQIQAAADTFIS